MTDQDRKLKRYLDLIERWSPEYIPPVMIAGAMKEKKSIHQYMFELELEEWIKNIDELCPGWREDIDFLAMVDDVLRKINQAH